MIARRHERPLTLDDYLALPETDHESEIIRGRLFMAPNPFPAHQWLMFDLATALVTRVVAAGGDRRQVLQDTDLIIDERGTYVSPDVMYFSPVEILKVLARPGIRVDIKNARPDLVVELVSSGSVARDVVDKRIEYAAVGIPHYWLLGPEPRRLRELALDPGSPDYRVVADVTGGQIVPRLFSGEPALVLDLDTLWGRP